MVNKMMHQTSHITCNGRHHKQITKNIMEEPIYCSICYTKLEDKIDEMKNDIIDLDTTIKILKEKIEELEIIIDNKDKIINELEENIV